MKILAAILLVSNLAFAQYYNERSTQQSFETSEIYFNSYYLNPFGIQHFKDVTPGLIDDPFLNLYVNPANIPDFEDKTALFYLDFRGDRTEAPVVTSYTVPMYYDRVSSYYLPIDRRWFYETRREPEPIVSFGLLTNPLKDITSDFFIGGTYQFLYNEDKFYTMPYGIYYPNVYYDAMGARMESADYKNFPVEDRYAAKDEMITSGHNFSVFTGYSFFGSLSLGLAVNGVLHEREGEYLRSSNDQKNNTYRSSSYDSKAKNEDYNHIDVTAGLNYNITDKLKIGVKAGILDGVVTQDYDVIGYYEYKYNVPVVSTEWSWNVSNDSTIQNWKQDGKTSYLGFNYNQALNENAVLNIYYKYTSEETDLTNSSTILSSSLYTSRYYSSYDTGYYSYGGYSNAMDLRTGTGERKRKIHEINVNLGWNLTQVTKVYIGVYHKNESAETFSAEPANVFRESSWFGDHTSRPQYDYNYYNSLKENKVLEWIYKADYSTLQIPVIFNFDFDNIWGLMLGINKIFNKWEISDETTAYLYFREENKNGVITERTEFGERYKQPVEHYTENELKVITSFYVNITDQFSTRLLLDPEFENQFRIAQWWLSFGINI